VLKTVQVKENTSKEIETLQRQLNGAREEAKSIASEFRAQLDSETVRNLF
jgi:hypothetical protein